jgi:hypothetical protein
MEKVTKSMCGPAGSGETKKRPMCGPKPGSNVWRQQITNDIRKSNLEKARKIKMGNINKEQDA